MDEEIQKVLSNNDMDADAKKNAINKMILEKAAADDGAEGEIEFAQQSEMMASFSK